MMRVIDSHTAGEPTRVIIDGGPDLGSGTLLERLNRFRREFDHYRRSIILEPRGSDAMVGALLCQPSDKTCSAGVIFFNNSDYLGMCGHGAIGVAITLYHLGRIELGNHRLETPVGIVNVLVSGRNEASVQNVASYCYQQQVELSIEGLGVITGDVAWGGNWFFLVNGAPRPLQLANVGYLTTVATKIKKLLAERGITGENGAEIDHIEFFDTPESSEANSRNFVLCPGNAYDRSPCGTGTSAKLACLAAKGLLQPGEKWVQESVIGSQFMAHYQLNSEQEIIPTISSSAYICSEATLIQQASDPFVNGIQ